MGNMNIDSASPMAAGFKAVKDAFESTYDCLGITCNDVGGLILSGMDYYEGAETCGKVSKGSCYNAKGDHSVVCDVAETTAQVLSFQQLMYQREVAVAFARQAALWQRRILAGTMMQRKMMQHLLVLLLNLNLSQVRLRLQPRQVRLQPRQPQRLQPLPLKFQDAPICNQKSQFSGASSFCQFFIIAELWPNFAPNFCNSPKLRNQTFNMFLRQSNASFELFQI